jgi:hypothetical protein
MGAPILPKVQRTTVTTLLADLKAHYETTGQRTLREAETRLTPLTRFFTSRRANAMSGGCADGLYSASTSRGHHQP